MSDIGREEVSGASEPSSGAGLTRAERRRHRRPPHAPRATWWVGFTFLASFALFAVGVVLALFDADAWAGIVVTVSLVLLLLAMTSDELLWLHETATQQGSWRSAFSAWRSKPREPIERSFRLYLTAALLTFGLVGGGLAVLVGPGQTMRWAGALALIGGLLLGAILALIVGRPAK